MEELTLKQVLDKSTEHFALRPALSQYKGETITYAVFYNRVQALSQYLKDQGVRKGDRVAILGENKPNWAIVYFAITVGGRVAVPIQPDFHFTEIKHILRHSAAKALFISNAQYERMEEWPKEFARLKINMDNFQPIEPSRKQKGGLEDIIKKGEKEFNRLKRAALSQSAEPDDAVTEDDLAAIIYTSGTTGHSKGVMLSHKNIVYDAMLSKEVISVSEQDRLLSILPLAHTYECTLGLVAPVYFGASVHYLGRPPTPSIMLPALKEVQPTIMLSVPLVIEKLYKRQVLPKLSGNRLLRSVTRVSLIRKNIARLIGKKLLAVFGGKMQAFCIGGASLAPDVEQFLREARFPYAVGYGLTESAPVAAASNVESTRYRSTGKALSGVEIKIHEPDPESGEGEVWIKGANIMKGYYRDEERTKQALTDEGWLRTGDLGVLDKDGYLYIKGRLKNVIVGSNGKNIYPEEIEALLSEYESVVESLVFSKEEKLYARVYLDYEALDQHYGVNRYSETDMKSIIDQQLKNIRDELNDRLPVYARLHAVIEQQEPFEKTPTHKIKRFLYN